MTQENQVVPDREPDLSEPQHIRFTVEHLDKINKISDETGQTFAACVRYLLGAGIALYGKTVKK